MMGVKKKRPYRKSTPIGRLRRNVDKVLQHSSLLKSRVTSWGVREDRVASWGVCEERVAAVEKLAALIFARATELDGLLVVLECSGFVPPEKQRTVKWEVGQRVAVGRKFRAKYEAAFRDVMRGDEGFLDSLVVETILPSGEISVRRRGRSPFLVPKTHLVEAEGESGG
jgi:hypothetical protein